MSPENERRLYLVIAQNLREFGYSGVSRNMIAEVHDAMKQDAPLPHGVVGMFAKGQIEEAQAAYVDVLCNLGERDSTAMRAALEAAVTTDLREHRKEGGP